MREKMKRSTAQYDKKNVRKKKKKRKKDKVFTCPVMAVEYNATTFCGYKEV